jgi:elongation factor 1-beta
MGRVAAVYNVIPESPEVPVDKIMALIPKSVPKGVEVNNMQVRPFAFGLNIIEVTCIMDDAEGIIEKLEEALKTVPEVQGVDSVTITLV